MDVIYRGLKKLGEIESSTVSILVDRYLPKIERLAHANKLIIGIKEYDKEGNRSKYSIHARLEAPSVFIAAKAHDWDLRRTLHKVLKKIENEAQHKFMVYGHTKRKPRETIK